MTDGTQRRHPGERQVSEGPCFGARSMWQGTGISLPHGGSPESDPHDRPLSLLSPPQARSAHTMAALGDPMPPEPALDETDFARTPEGIRRGGDVPADRPGASR
jgi:hypothetical protein